MVFPQSDEDHFISPIFKILEFLGLLKCFTLLLSLIEALMGVLQVCLVMPVYISLLLMLNIEHINLANTVI